MIGLIDTSALIRLFIPDGPIPEGLQEFFTGVETGLNMAIAPELIIAEVANVIFKKKTSGELSNEEGEQLLIDILGMPIRFFDHMPLVFRAYQLAEKFQLTVYDALFLSLAVEKSAIVFSADEKIVKTANTLGLSGNWRRS
jgi:predicted nucleic acid-binding protein